MEKLLHERLRDFADDEYQCSWKEFCEAVGNGAYESNYQGFAKILADEIEHNYTPRPRFEDDAPLQWGEMVDGYDKPIDGIKLFNDGSGRVGNHRDSDLHWFPFSNVKKASLKRPSPKVLDADGVEMKKGDTVWSVENGKKAIVAGVGNFEIGFHKGNVMLEGCHVPYNGSSFTHKEPDSLSNLLKDMEDLQEIDDVIPEWIDRLTALIERDK